MTPSTAQPFYQFLREERQFSFLLAFFLMQKGEGLSCFLDLIRQRVGEERLPHINSAQLDDAEVYVEYAYLRDKWDSLLERDQVTNTFSPAARKAANERKKAFIIDLLRRVGLAELADELKFDNAADFNAHFMGVAAGSAIKRDIASPALWSVASLANQFGETSAVFHKLCRLKWSFHIKPDLVVMVPGLATICVEAKLESSEGSYPTGKETKDYDRICVVEGRVKQFALQQFMFETLLGQECLPVVVQRAPKEQACPVLTWKEVFDRFRDRRSLDSAIPFVTRLVDQNATLQEKPTRLSSGSAPPAPLRQTPAPRG